MALTYESIATTTLGTANTTITFNSIPNTYTDLKLVLLSNGTVSNQSRWIRFNGDSASNYSQTYLLGSGSTVTGADQLSISFIDPTQGVGTSTTIPQMWTWDIFSYASSVSKTSLFSFIGDLNGTGSTITGVSIWASTAAITSITIGMSGSGSMAVGTTANLYGIKAA